jgi:hypothetical protein
VIFLSGDDDDAKAEVIALFEGAGFFVIDLGHLIEGGEMQQVHSPLAGVNLVRLPMGNQRQRGRPKPASRRGDRATLATRPPVQLHFELVAVLKSSTAFANAAACTARVVRFALLVRPPETCVTVPFRAAYELESA